MIYMYNVPTCSNTLYGIIPLSQCVIPMHSLSCSTCVPQVFKDPLERPQQRGGPILSHEDIKSVFSNTPEILTVHQKLVAGLEEQIAQWSESTCIGKVLLGQVTVATCT